MANAENLLVFYGEHTASLGLYLDGLPPALAAHVCIRQPHSLPRDLPFLATAGLVVHVRGFDNRLQTDVSKALTRLGVPLAWFTDDDFVALAQDQPGFANYSLARLCAFARSLVAIIGTTRPLCATLRTFYPRVLHWPCVLDASLLAPMHTASAEPHVIAVFGGSFRAGGLRQSVLPALAALPGAQLLVSTPLANAAPDAVVLPEEPNFQTFIATWRARHPTIMAHPPGNVANLRAKGPGSLLAALYMGAVPVVADEPAFMGLNESNGVFIADATPASWASAFKSLAAPQARQAALAALRRHCVATYTAEPAAAAITELLALAAPGGSAATRRRRAARLVVLRYRLSHHVSSLWRSGQNR